MNDTGAQKKRKWIPIVLGVLAVLVILAIGGIVLTVVFVRQNMSMAEMSATAADAEFNKMRERFAGQQPMFNFVNGRPQLAERPTGTPSTTPLTTMHFMAWDDDEQKLVRFSLPFWLLRMKSGPIEISSYSDGWDDRGMSFRVEDLEKHGPGLLMDLNEPTEGRVLIWTE